MKPYTFRVNKQKAEFRKDGHMQEAVLEFENITEQFSKGNFDWFRSLDEIIQAGLYGQWLHKAKDQSTFDRWLSHERELSNL